MLLAARHARPAARAVAAACAPSSCSPTSFASSLLLARAPLALAPPSPLSLSALSFSSSSSSSSASATAAAPPAQPAQPAQPAPLAPDAPTPAFGVYTGNKRVDYVSRLDAHAPERQPGMACFRLMDERGLLRPDAEASGFVLPPRAEIERMYTTMLRLTVMDAIFYDSQRQGRISFYMTNSGEEGIVGAAAALRPDDVVFAQYREAGVLMWRGFSLQQFADHCFLNADDLSKGRQMPVHYGSRELHFQTISSPLCTKLPQAAGCGYALRLERKGRVAVCFFGEGAASEGDFHAGLNMAATSETPTIFFCRNNGFAISTPVTEQYRGDGIAARGVAYGMHTIRVDGNDVFAVLEATRAARAIASGADGSGRTKPVLIEAMQYRESHHSTSDDSTRYRDPKEIEAWRTTANPVRRLRAFLEQRGWWNSAREAAVLAEARTEVMQALQAAEKKERPAFSGLFEDVYGDAELPQSLARQKLQLDEHLLEHEGHYAGAPKH